ncbi:MAG: OmpA family protein [Bdellovibrionales bacterium]|nr:OmpA family protein [Bdellovibrionales bacterium]
MEKRMLKKSYFKMIYVILLSVFFLSCSYLEKVKDIFKETPEVEGVEDISFIDDVETSQTGSDSGNIQGLSSVYFDLDSSELKEGVKETLRANKAWLDSKPSVVNVILEGHCDPLGSEAYNIGLGERRAQRVYNYLISLGVSADKLSIVSYGEEKPISQTDNSLNRRVNFIPQY